MVGIWIVTTFEKSNFIYQYLKLHIVLRFILRLYRGMHKDVYVIFLNRYNFKMSLKVI